MSAVWLDTPYTVLETPRLVRVIAGALGGRRLQAPRGMETRPTTDRVREAVFMTLEPLEGLRVVDLFAGSGAMGIEALSRGAAHVDFVEFARAARRVLERNLSELELVDRATVWPVSLPRGLNRMRERLEQADVVILDPPYGGEDARATLEALSQFELRDQVRVVADHHSRDVLAESIGSLRRVRERRYGETRISTFRRETGEEDSQSSRDSGSSGRPGSIDGSDSEESAS
jgi:16S rRNA (guanine966-N2)-methyltransferase